MAGATKDARRHGVQVQPVDVMHSDVDASLEDLPEVPAMRLGLRMVRGLRDHSAERIVQERSRAPFDSAQDLARRCHLELHEMKLLAAAGALQRLAGHRRQQVWEAAALHAVPELLHGAPVPAFNIFSSKLRDAGDNLTRAARVSGDRSKAIKRAELMTKVPAQQHHGKDADQGQGAGP